MEQKALQPKKLTTQEFLAAALGHIQELETENSYLNTKLDNLTDYLSIITVAKLNGINETAINWRFLKQVCLANGWPIKKALSPRFGSQNLYSVNAWKVCYPDLDYNLKNTLD